MLKTKIIQNTEHLKVCYISISRTNSKTKVPTGYSRSPSLHLKSNWLAEAGFETGRGVTVKVSVECQTIIADHNEMQKLCEQLYQEKQVVKGVKEVLV